MGSGVKLDLSLRQPRLQQSIPEGYQCRSTRSTALRELVLNQRGAFRILIRQVGESRTADRLLNAASQPGGNASTAAPQSRHRRSRDILCIDSLDDVGGGGR